MNTIAFLFRSNMIPPKDWKDINDATPGFLGLCKHLGPTIWGGLNYTTLETPEPQEKDGFLRWFYHANGTALDIQDRAKAYFCQSCLTAMGAEVAALAIKDKDGMDWFHSPEECKFIT